MGPLRRNATTTGEASRTRGPPARIAMPQKMEPSAGYRSWVTTGDGVIGFARYQNSRE